MLKIGISNIYFPSPGSVMVTQIGQPTGFSKRTLSIGFKISSSTQNCSEPSGILSLIIMMSAQPTLEPAEIVTTCGVILKSLPAGRKGEQVREFQAPQLSFALTCCTSYHILFCWAKSYCDVAAGCLSSTCKSDTHPCRSPVLNDGDIIPTYH